MRTAGEGGQQNGVQGEEGSNTTVTHVNMHGGESTKTRNQNTNKYKPRLLGQVQ